MSQPSADAPAVIDLFDVGRVYPGPPPVTALRPTRLTIRRGEFVAITGPSGSGKSTLLHLLGLLDVPTAGRYLFDGVDTRTLSDWQLASLRGGRIGFVFQSFHLLPHRTAMENVAIAQLYNRAPRAGRRSAAREALHHVGLGHRIMSLPSTMSGGERQRVAIARALVNRPSLLLCDEPTGNLDSRNAAAVLDLIAELHSDGYTIVMITHDLQVADRAERIITIRDGRLSASVLAP